MVEQIKIKNFKLFEKQVVFDNLRALNLLTGINGRGKSSFLQSMLLMNQSILKNENTKSLVLKGDNINVGTTDDAKNSNVSISETISFEFINEEGSHHYDFVPQGRGEDMIPIDKFKHFRSGDMIEATSRDEWYNMLPALFGRYLSLGKILRNLQYVAANRIEPRLRYESDSPNRVKPNATNCVCVLDNHKDDTVRNEYLDVLAEVFPSWKRMGIVADISLGGQVEYWLTKMFGETKVVTSYVKEADVYTLQYKTLSRQGSFKPTNVGYGYSYVLPILVAGLIAQKDDILIVENPEAHLHPQGQSVIAKFLACIAMSGVQVFVETHSEHILNGIRVLMRQDVLTPQDVSVKFFFENEKFYKEIIINEKGEVQDWPQDFFDQEEHDLDVLLS
jgi:predicted ATPase